MIELEKLPREAMVGLKVVTRVTDSSRSTIYREVAAGRFPAPYRVSPRSSRWCWGEILDHLEELKRQSRQPADDDRGAA